MRSGLASFALWIVAASAPSWSTREAHADPAPAELAAARELFKQGLELEDKGDWAAALTTFQRVAVVKKTAAVQFHLALCLEKTGRLVDAINGFTVARTIAAAEATPDALTIDASATKHLEALEQRIPHVQIVWPLASVAATVTIDGAEVSSALIGAQLPLDPGHHRVVVTAPGYERFDREVTLIEGAATERLVVIATATREARDRGTSPSSAGPGAAPWVLLTGGAVLLGASGLFLSLRATAISDLQGACGDGGAHCPPDKQSEYDQSRTYTWLGDATLITGLVAVGGAIVWLSLPTGSSSTSKDASVPKVGVSAAPGGMTFTLRGAF
ncbi:MAG: PEGA domain-containing protein [Polyangiales bacterium]